MNLLTRKALLIILPTLVILTSTGTLIVVRNIPQNKSAEVLSAQEVKETPTSTPTTELSITPDEPSPVNTAKKTPTVKPTSTSQSTTTQSLVSAAINEYTSQQANSQPIDCTTEKQAIQQKYQTQINDLELQKEPYRDQIKTLEDALAKTLNECCGGNPYAQAAMSGSVATQKSDTERQVSILNNKISDLSNQQNVLGQLMLNEERMACNLPVQPVNFQPVTYYIQKKLPTYYTITPNGSDGFYIQGGNESCNVTPNGSGGYFVSCN